MVFPKIIAALFAVFCVMAPAQEQEQKPIKADSSIKLGDSEVTVKKGQVLEVKIHNPPLPVMVQNVEVKCDDGVKHMGDRQRPDKTEDGKVLIGSGWYCVYLKANASGSALITYRKGQESFSHTVRIKLN